MVLVTALVGSAGIGGTVADAASQPRPAVVEVAPGHYQHGPGGCHWYQYFAGRWWGPTSKPYAAGPYTTFVWNSSTGTLFQCF